MLSSLVFLLVAISSAFATSKLTFQGGNFSVEWTYLPSSKQIEFNLTVKTVGWASIGISKKNSGMADLDLYAGAHNGGASYMKDYYSTSKAKPPEDTKKDVTNFASSESGGFTSLSFRRLLDTGDAAKDVLIKAGDQYYLAWAYGSSDSFGYHYANKGYSSLVTLVKISSLATTSSSMTSAAPTTQPPSDLNFKNGDYKVQWTYNSIAKDITFKVSVKGTGWIGFAISEHNTGMKDMDVAILTANNSSGTVEDYFSTSLMRPSKDAKQDFTLVKSSQNGGKTVIEFKRALKTSDAEKDIEIVPGKSYYIAWAYSPSSAVFSKHAVSDRGYSASKVVLAPGSATTASPTATGTCLHHSWLALLLATAVAILCR